MYDIEYIEGKKAQLNTWVIIFTSGNIWPKI
jgi:hypothetical protein